MSDSLQILPSKRVLARNVLWNFLGLAAPLVVAVVSIPVLLSGMGAERFGLLAIIWAGVGYFSLFDLGLGRALTKMVSARLGCGEVQGLGPLVWTAMFLLGVLGMLGSLFLMMSSSYLVTGLLQVPYELYDEGVAALRILAIGLPIVTMNAGVVGLLEAHQRFRIVAAIRIPMGVLTFAGPLVTLQFTPSLAYATIVLVLGRVVGFMAYYLAAVRVRNELRSPHRIQLVQLRSLLTFGGWITVSNIVGPLMTYLDRFFIGALLGMTAVAYYVTPYEVLSRLQIISKAVMGVAFPAMSAAHPSGTDRLNDIYSTSSSLVYWLMLPLTVSAFLLAPEVLDMWLGSGFREASTVVVYWLAAGWLINTIARPVFTVLQSAGRPDLVAKAHVLELMPYLGLLWWLTNNFGIVGAAAAWSIRAAADAVILITIAGHVLGRLRALVYRSYAKLLISILMFGLLFLLDSLFFRVIALVVVVLVSGFVLFRIAFRLLGIRHDDWIKRRKGMR